MLGGLLVVVAVFVAEAVSLLHESGADYVWRAAGDLGALYLPLAVSPSSPCGRAMGEMATALESNEISAMWAKHMIDSWGKTTDGQYFFNPFNGFYDECVTAASPGGRIKGKHCRIYTRVTTSTREGESTVPDTDPAAEYLAFLRRHVGKPDPALLGSLAREPRMGVMPLAVPFGNVQYDTCMPDVCTKEELQNSLLQAFLPHGVFPSVVVCSVQDERVEFTDGDVGFMSLVSFLLGLVVCSSVVDIYLHYTDSQHLAKGVLRYLLVFSAYTNLAKILQVNPKASPGNITCLHAMRTLSMVWVIWCHQQMTPLINMANIITFIMSFKNILGQAIMNGYPSVDTFFFLSGLLVTYSLLRQSKRTNTFNLPLFYVHRFMRLVPPIGLTVGLYATVMRFVVTGPIQSVWSSFFYPTCQQYWWRDVFFLDNFYFDSAVCVGQAWYLGADMQLYLVAPLIILPLYFTKSFGKAWLFLVTALSAIVPAAIIYHYDLPPTYVNNPLVMPEKTDGYTNKIYPMPWTRASPWLAGVWLGYIFYKQGNTKYKMNALTVCVGWTVATITGLLVVFGMFSYNRVVVPMPYEVMTQVVYGGGHRLAWGAVLAWVVFACHNGYGGVVNGFLSHPVWQPVSRLTYTTYLLALPVQYIIHCNTSQGGAYYFSHLNMLISTVGAVVVTLPLALLLSLLAESPVVGLERILLRPNHNTPRPAPPSKGEAAPPPPANPDGDSAEAGTTITTTTTTTTTNGVGFSNPVFTVEEVTKAS
ncbi:nose resistant to fluoxetine protein 6-like isoform X1 [Portunus trituberculatus]|uniref:nose resistant to fluoxetine protein 6-like isoform X1 n=1 Tax=Portunus trituberculatus TaxID=210409 RepID=UPI001E1D09A2|nr:nose resistant to fluoxetine protein 6-like isoform X1 [Portunus trituberculatus]